MENLSIHHFSAIWISEDENDQMSTQNLISIVKSILCVTCIFAVIVNLKVFACIYWIRRPLNSILKISLSLALADSCASCLSAVIIFYESLMTTRSFIILETIRLCFILVTVFHLLGLAFNHYIGIRKPLLHNSRLTQKGTSGLLVLLWFIPTMFTISLYTVEGGTTFWQAIINDNLIENKITTNINSSISMNGSSYAINDTIFQEWNQTLRPVHLPDNSSEIRESPIKFIETFRFRMAIALFILISMLLIVVCYVWILIMIKRQQKIWKDLSRTGSTVWRGHNCRHTSKERTHEQNKMKGNFRAVYTTLIILGSCFMGWMPALLLYTLTCSQDCFISGELLVKFNEYYPRHIVMVRFFDNEMLLLKMIANPIIYSIRIKEIKEGTRQMHNVLMYHLFGKQCSRNHRDRHSKSFSKSGNTNHCHLALASSKSIRNSKNDSEKGRKKTDQASYL